MYGVLVLLCSPAVALLNELRDDADRDLTRLIGTDIQANRAVERSGVLFWDTGHCQLLHKHGPLRFTANDPQEGELPILTQDFFQDRAVSGVSHRHANDERVAWEFGNDRSRFSTLDFSQPRSL